MFHPQLKHRFALTIFVLTTMLLGGCYYAENAVTRVLGDRHYDQYWLQYDPESRYIVSHAPWDEFLGKYVETDNKGINRIAYARVSNEDKKILHNYLNGLAAIPVTKLNRNEQLAYWLNLYNAIVVSVVMENYPVGSFKDIDSRYLGPEVYNHSRIAVEGKGLNLNDVRDKIIRYIWLDERVYYGLNDAAVGSPNIQKNAFTAGNARYMLTRAAHQFINSERGVKIKPNGDVIISKIYKDYRHNFGGSNNAILTHLRHYADPGLKTALDNKQSINGYQFNDDLNDSLYRSVYQ